MTPPEGTPKLPQDEDTSPGDHSTTLYQQLIIIYDDLTPSNREQFLVLANAFANVDDFEKDMLVTTALKLARLL